MSQIVYAHQGDSIDAICQRYFGRTAGITEQVLQQNPALADQSVILPEGTAVRFPDLPAAELRPVIALWE